MNKLMILGILLFFRVAFIRANDDERDGQAKHQYAQRILDIAINELKDEIEFIKYPGFTEERTKIASEALNNVIFSPNMTKKMKIDKKELMIFCNKKRKKIEILKGFYDSFSHYGPEADNISIPQAKRMMLKDISHIWGWHGGIDKLGKADLFADETIRQIESLNRLKQFINTERFSMNLHEGDKDKANKILRNDNNTYLLTNFHPDLLYVDRMGKEEEAVCINRGIISFNVDRSLKDIEEALGRIAKEQKSISGGELTPLYGRDNPDQTINDYAKTGLKINFARDNTDIKNRKTISEKLNLFLKDPLNKNLLKELKPDIIYPVYDPEGYTTLEFNCGILTINLGYPFDKIRKALKEAKASYEEEYKKKNPYPYYIKTKVLIDGKLIEK